MAAVTTFDGLLARISNEYDETFHTYGENSAGRGRLTSGTADITCVQFGWSKAVPGSLPTGVTAYIPVEIALNMSVGTVGHILVAEMINLGNINMNGGSFTDGAAMPTRTELGQSNQIPSPILAVATTALNATPGTYAVTYTDQSGNTGNSTGTLTPAASSVVGSAALLPLAAGDWGAIDITNATKPGAGTTPSGVITFYGVIPLAFVPVAVSIASVEDTINSGIIRRLGSSAQIGYFWLGTSSGPIQAFTGYTRMVGDS